MAKLEQRVDDLVADFLKLEGLPVQMAEQKLTLDNALGKIDGCADRVDSLRRDIEEEREHQQQRREAEAIAKEKAAERATKEKAAERKADRKWFAGISLGVATMVIGGISALAAAGVIG
jgi:peptidoglycan hydrolase CwlO-like protein